MRAQHETSHLLQDMKRLGRSDKEADEEASKAEQGTNADSNLDKSNDSARDSVPQLPSIARNSIAVGRGSSGPSTPLAEVNAHGNANGSAAPALVKVRALLRPNPSKEHKFSSKIPGLFLTRSPYLGLVRGRIYGSRPMVRQPRETISVHI